MAFAVFEALNAEEIPYWADFGTLLGLYRNGDIILYDNDVDVCLPAVTDEALERLGTRLRAAGFGFYIRRYDSISRVYSGSYFTDLYHVFFSEDESIVHGATGGNSDIPGDLIGDFRMHTLPFRHGGRTVLVHVPANVPGVLEWRYGSDYMVPRPGYKGRNRTSLALACQGRSVWDS